jgi:hypothetical protein
MLEGTRNLKNNKKPAKKSGITAKVYTIKQKHCLCYSAVQLGYCYELVIYNCLKYVAAQNNGVVKGVRKLNPIIDVSANVLRRLVLCT